MCVFSFWVCFAGLWHEWATKIFKGIHIQHFMWNRGRPTIFYKTSCLDGTCLFCGSLQLLSTCQHMDSTHVIGNEIVDYEKFKTVAYALKDGK